MGTLFHQFSGIPVDKSTVKSLEACMKDSLMLEPAIEDVEVHINEERLEEHKTLFEYPLSGDVLEGRLYAKVDNVTAVIRIEYVEEINYPLVYVEDIIEE